MGKQKTQKAVKPEKKARDRKDKKFATGAEAVTWDLTDLYPSVDDLKARLAAAERRAESFGNRYRGTLGALDAGALASAIDELGQILDESGRAYTYAYLNWVTDTADSDRGALLQFVKEGYTRVTQSVVFFDVEWAHLDDERASVVLASPLLSGYRHFLELQRLHRKHVLTEPEEKVVSEMSVNGRQAWNRYFDETISAMRFKLKGKYLTEQEVLARLHEPDRKERRKAAAAFTDVLKQHERTLTYVFNTVLADKASQDRLRGYSTWISSRNQSNEVSDETVEALVKAVTDRYDLVHRFYKLKRKILGVRRLYDYDRYAPVGDADTKYTWAEAKTLVIESYASFHARLGEIVTEFFDRRWIDAAVAPGKRGGAFSHGAVPSVHPYILLNYTGRSRDVQTLAHELGHGVHQYLSRVQGVFHADTPLTTAETASVFGEMLTFQRIIAGEDDLSNRLAMLVGKIDDTMATVFRQVTMNRFEDRIHNARREGGELTAKDFAAHWKATQSAMYGKSVRLSSDYDSWWSYIPHFLHTPGYVYAYAFGELLVLALYERYQTEGSSFAERYLDLLSAGGSDWPHNLLKPLGVDLTDLSFWQQGLASIEKMIDQAEAIHAKVK
ncbi:MAG: M3 family oligoendopeptidase [Bacteroidetes bacterium]|nr:M3 family oligoendopeptidase [Bacteroidota bacterium]